MSVLEVAIDSLFYSAASYFGCVNFDAERVVVSTSCSLLHTAVDLKNETKFDNELKGWLAFAAQKVLEVVALANALNGNKDKVKSKCHCLSNKSVQCVFPTFL